MSAIEQAAYAIWRFEMWNSGIGSYEDIDWLVSMKILRPYRTPSRNRLWLAKKALAAKRIYWDRLSPQYRYWGYMVDCDVDGNKMLCFGLWWVHIYYDTGEPYGSTDM